MEAWLQELFSLLPGGWTYLFLIGLIAFLESLPVVGLIVPGSTLILFSGFLALHGKGEILPIMVVATCGAILGDLSSYFLGARSGATLLQTRPMQKRQKMVHRAELFFSEHGGKSIFFARFAGPIRGLVPFIAGCARMRPVPLTFYVLVSGPLWGLAYPGIGYLAGASWQNVEMWSGRFALLIGLLGVATFISVWFRRR
jgi:undecaprenyl-diphosphatase